KGEGSGRRRAEGEVDRVRGQGARRSVHVGEVHELRVEPLVLEEAAGLEVRPEAEGDAARPVADANLLGVRGQRAGEAQRQRDEGARRVVDELGKGHGLSWRGKGRYGPLVWFAGVSRRRDRRRERTGPAAASGVALRARRAIAHCLRRARSTLFVEASGRASTSQTRRGCW